MSVLCVVGIDTGIGKSVAVGLLAAGLRERGRRVVTQKLVQTGCAGPSEDLLLHRRLMGEDWGAADRAGLTCPYCFAYPASPHLAAEREGLRIAPERLERATAGLAMDHDLVIVEAAGGLLVPLTRELLLLDYLADRGYPLVLVSSSRLGSINHTLLALEAIRSRGLGLLGLIYNLHGGAPAAIRDDSRRVMTAALPRYGFEAPVLDMPEYAGPGSRPPWSALLERL